MCDSGRVERYQAEGRVYRIDSDGESWWYLAESAWEALRAFQAYEVETEDDLRVRVCSAKELLTIRDIDDASEELYPAAWLSEDHDEDEEPPREWTATMAEWAWRHDGELARRGAHQLCTSTG